MLAQRDLNLVDGTEHEFHYAGIILCSLRWKWEKVFGRRAIFSYSMYFMRQNFVCEHFMGPIAFSALLCFFS